MSLLEIRSLRVSYGQMPILCDVSFSAERGEMIGILGANGCGKTTMLKAICGILPHEGSCLLNGTRLEEQSVRQIAARCAYIPQRSGIGIEISALDVVLMGFNPRLGLLEHPNAQMRAQALAALREVGLGGREHESYLTLSEGQRQLCILARTLVSDGQLLLLDEPESALDLRYRDRMLGLLQTWVGQGERVALLTLHDPALALQYCDRLLLLHEGKICGMLCPARDEAGDMERALSVIYGEVSLHRCTDRQGRSRLVMLKE